MADTDEPSVDACSDIEMSAFCVVLLREGLTELWQEFAPCVENPLHGSDKPIRSHGLDKLADVRSKASFVGLMCEKSIPAFRYLFVEPHRLISMRNAAQVLDLDRMAVDYLDLVNEVDTYIPQVSSMVPFERQKIVAKAVICDVAKWVMLPKDTQDSYWLDSNLIGWSDGSHPLHQRPHSPRDETVDSKIDPLVAARKWLTLPSRKGGPSVPQRDVVSWLVESGGHMPHADINFRGEFDWQDVRKGASNLAGRINKKLEANSETWRIVPEDKSGCTIVKAEQINPV